jgi:hypothetical protein
MDKGNSAGPSAFGYEMSGTLPSINTLDLIHSASNESLEHTFATLKRQGTDIFYESERTEAGSTNHIYARKTMSVDRGGNLGKATSTSRVLSFDVDLANHTVGNYQIDKSLSAKIVSDAVDLSRSFVRHQYPDLYSRLKTPPQQWIELEKYRIEQEQDKAWIQRVCHSYFLRVNKGKKGYSQPRESAQGFDEILRLIMTVLNRDQDQRLPFDASPSISKDWSIRWLASCVLTNVRDDENRQDRLTFDLIETLVTSIKDLTEENVLYAQQDSEKTASSGISDKRPEEHESGTPAELTTNSLANSSLPPSMIGSTGVSETGTLDGDPLGAHERLLAAKIVERFQELSQNPTPVPSAAVSEVVSLGVTDHLQLVINDADNEGKKRGNLKSDLITEQALGVFKTKTHRGKNVPRAVQAFCEVVGDLVQDDLEPGQRVERLWRLVVPLTGSSSSVKARPPAATAQKLHQK